MQYPFYTNCVNWPEDDIDSLITMIETAQQISYHTFRSHVTSDQLRELFPDYAWGPGRKGLRMSKDFAVSFYRSKVRKHTVYYVRWSAIEFVFGRITNASANE